ncbi:hypothetical protein FACS1894132_07780 [Clostridia bacterium]|nr:hypothetical protein FACS1894132_07780 [Clostridia bacterium]
MKAKSANIFEREKLSLAAKTITALDISANGKISVTVKKTPRVSYLRYVVAIPAPSEKPLESKVKNIIGCEIAQNPQNINTINVSADEYKAFVKPLKKL